MSGSARSSVWPRTTRRVRSRSPPRTTGRGGSTARGGAFDRATTLRSPAALAPFAAKTSSPRPSSSASRTARPRGSSSASSTRRRSTQSPIPILRGQVMHTTLHRFYAMLPRELDSERVTPENLERRDRCSSIAVSTTPSSPASASISPSCRPPSFGTRSAPTSRASCVTRPLPRSRFVPRRLEVAFGSERAPPGAAARTAARRRPLALREDRPDRHRPVQRPRDRPGLQVRQGRAHRAGDRPGATAPDPAVHPRAARSRRVSSHSEACTARSPAGGSRAGCCGRARARIFPGSRRTTISTRTTFWSQVESARERAAENASRIREGDVQHDPKGDGCPSWCDLWPMCRVARA